MTPRGGATKIATALLMAFCPSLEAADAELLHMAQPCANAGTAHKHRSPTSRAALRLAACVFTAGCTAGFTLPPTRECGTHPERRPSSSPDKTLTSTW